MNTPQDHFVTQILHWKEARQERLSPADTLFASAGRRIYVLGDIDGQFRPRSNPYDLYSLGRPSQDDPLAEKLQGVWAQPVKGVSGYAYTLRWNDQPWALRDANTFTQEYASVEFQHQHGPVLALRRDFTAQDLPILFSTLTLKNQGIDTLEIEVTFSVRFDLQDAWFTHLAEQRNSGQSVTVEEGRLVARSVVLPDQWVAAAGTQPPPGCRKTVARISPVDENTGELIILLRLEPGGEVSLSNAMVVECQGGAPTALALLDEGLARREALFSEKSALYTAVGDRAPHLVSPDPAINTAFDLALMNLQMLEADAPGMGRYFYAGLEMFPFWFSNDGAYSIPGLMAGGFSASALNHVLIGLDYLQNGCVPHQISPSGKVAFSGNAQETPQWVTSIWDAYRWSGDRAFLERLYHGALHGLFDYVLGTIDTDGDGYASGPGMVEAEGMGAEKLDTAAYTWAALHALAQMAATLGDQSNADQARSRAEEIAARFDADWWDDSSGTYAMSLEDPGNHRRQVPHWAVIVPLEVGLAPAEHAAATFTTLHKEYLNRWGLKHTVGNDERVWTLPTATLSRAAYRYGERAMGEEMLRHLADTLQHGSIGLFHELIPQGACIVQLWSAATFIRGIIEDMAGVEVHAAEHALRITPQIPASWKQMRLDNLSFGEHRVSLCIETGKVYLEHLAGNSAIHVEVVFPPGKPKSVSIEPGQFIVLEKEE
jgi:glycogen debranching enzyme